MSDNKTFVHVALIIFGFFTCVACLVTFNQYMHYSRVKSISRYELDIKFGPGHKTQSLAFEERVVD